MRLRQKQSSPYSLKSLYGTDLVLSWTFTKKGTTDVGNGEATTPTIQNSNSNLAVHCERLGLVSPSLAHPQPDKGGEI